MKTFILISLYIERNAETLKRLISYEMKTRRIAEINISVIAMYEDPIKLLMLNEDDVEVNAVTDIVHHVKNEVITFGSDMDKVLEKARNNLREKLKNLKVADLVLLCHALILS